MKGNRKKDWKKCGIYCIYNSINNKIYIGKSINIYTRINQHVSLLNNKSKDENIHLINSWHKYGKDNFNYKVIEYLDVNEDLLKERELFWIELLKSDNRKYGYNIRKDSSTNMIISNETIIKLSNSQKLRYKNNPNDCIKQSIRIKEFWKNNPNIKKQMSEKLSIIKQKYKFEQYDLNMNYIKTWNSVKEIILENPNFKWNNIYSVCNGYKPTIYGYIWKKIPLSN